ncbi:Adenylate cyclase (EC [Olavius algarvensis Delta 1 endosymbiont]|nr:Adenylate cyclase (EC [Olavius algarvensis Delta 1 endosymbiont]
MKAKDLISGKPMTKDASCINILTCEHYLKGLLSGVSYREFFDGITGNKRFLVTDEETGRLIPVDSGYLLSADHWVSNELLSRVYRNTVAMINDPAAIYKAGRKIFKTAVGSQVFLMRMAGVQTIIERLPRENAKFNRNRSVEVVENKNGLAVVRIFWNDAPGINKHFCEMNKGVYEGLGKLTGNPATVKETLCQFEAGDFCEYHIKWRAKPIFSRYLDLIRFHISRDIIEELERRIEEVNNYRLKQERIIELRTQDLQKQKNMVDKARKFLSRYVPSQLASKILAGEVEPVQHHQRRKLTMLFSDIKDFTRTTDTMEPEDMGRLLNEYFTCMTDIIQKYEGTLANITGDALFIFFGAPDRTNDRDQALRCVRMAVEMQQTMDELQLKWFNEGVENPLQIRCGINTGMATVGSFGSRRRSEYSAMGMQVNLASRLEAACKPGGVLISHSTWALVNDQIETLPHATIEVKGFSRPIMAYEVVVRDDVVIEPASLAGSQTV